MELKTFFAQDTQGTVIANPTVYLYQPGTSTLATGLKDASNNALTNPFQGNDKGRIILAAPDGNYDLRVVGAGRDTTMPVRFLSVTEDSVALANAAAEAAETARDEAEAAAFSIKATPPLLALEAKLSKISLGFSELARVLVIGDSVSGDIALPLLRPMVRAYGNGGVANGSEQIGFTTTLSGGAAVTSTNDYSVWPGGKWTEIPSGGSLVYGWNTAHTTDYPLPAGGVYPIGYLTFIGGGSFSVQDSVDGVSWSTLTTINTNAAAGYVSTTVTGTAGRRYIRLLGVSGTSRIVSRMIGSASGYRMHSELSIGGSIAANYMQAPASIWDSYLTACAPDLIFVYWKDDVNPAYSEALASLQARIFANCPNADVVYIGPTQSQADNEDPESATYYQSAKAQRAAIYAHVSSITNMRAWYWDASKVWGTWAVGNALGLFLDVVHPNDFGRIVLTEQFCKDFGLFQSAISKLPWNLSATQIAFAGGFLSSGGSINGATRIADGTDVSGVDENTGSAALRISGGVYAAKTIRTDKGLAVGTDIGSINSLNAAKTIGSANWTVSGYTLNTSAHNASGSFNWTGSGSYVNVNHGGSVTNTGTIRGAFAQVKESGSGTGTLSNVHGSFSGVELSGSHPVSTAVGQVVDVQSYGSGNVTNMYGVRLTSFKGGASAITNLYGVHLPATLAGMATNAWAFYNDSTLPSLSKGSWIWRPSESVSSLPANGDFSIEATSNASVTLVFRGTDGTTRRSAPIALS